MSLLLSSSLKGAPPRLGPAGNLANGGLQRNQARIQNMYGLLRLRLVGVLSLRDEAGPYQMVRVEALNNRSRTAFLRRANFIARLPDGTWLAPEGIADRPPLEGLLRPTLNLAQQVSLTRDQAQDVYAVFRTDQNPQRIDFAAQFDARPFFLKRPLNATPEDLAADAIGFAKTQKFALARGVLAEAAAQEADRVRLGKILIEFARKLRVADQPVLEDRILRLSLPYAPNPAFVHARLSELRKRLRRRYSQDGYRPAVRDWSYHSRRSERYKVDRRD